MVTARPSAITLWRRCFADGTDIRAGSGNAEEHQHERDGGKRRGIPQMARTRTIRVGAEAVAHELGLIPAQVIAL
ncbi:hypothetical protein GCM10010176_086450 [Nonomuraea spiralis]|nr:hypothetical protein GCM10010176_086450 [Nonomuraea spiralis]